MNTHRHFVVAISHHYGIISASTCGGLIKHISPHLAFRAALHASHFSEYWVGHFIIMTTKKCSKCEDVKSLAEFNKQKSKKDGLSNYCKDCNKARCKLYHNANKASINERSRQYNKINKEDRAKYNKRYNKINKEKIAKQRKQYVHTNKESLAKKQKQYQQVNRENINTYKRHRYATNVAYKAECRLRSRLNRTLKGNTKTDSTMDLVGCDRDQLVFHIESQFTNGMTWHGIHIDHIRPCASFDLSDPEQQRECFHYTNLQPLWAKDNLEKSDKW